jgi:hypothetical protein
MKSSGSGEAHKKQWRRRGALASKTSIARSFRFMAPRRCQGDQRNDLPLHLREMGQQKRLCLRLQHSRRFHHLQGSTEDESIFYMELSSLSKEITAQLRKNPNLAVLKYLARRLTISQAPTRVEQAIRSKAAYAEKFNAATRLNDEVVVFAPEMVGAKREPTRSFL